MERYIGKDWSTKKEIIARAKENGIVLHERVWRKFVEDYNKKYWSHDVDTYIVHGSKGYKLTTDKEEIKASIQDSKKRALNLLWKYSQTRKAMGEADNIMFDLKEKGII